MLLLIGFGYSTANAQFVPYYESGQGVAPVYEGWYGNDDGSYTMLFGYMNENWEEELNVPIGNNNSFSPGPTDRGQPTHFLPRRNRYVFKVNIPADFGNKELIWTLLTREGVTQKAYASLRKDYFLEPITMMSEGGTVGGGSNNSEDVQTNEPPTVILEQKMVTARVGVPLELVAIVKDDGKPNTRHYRLGAFSDDDTPEERFAKAMRPPIRGTVDRVVGLFFGWFVYRGEGDVEFSPPQGKSWEDTRAFQNSPWSPYWRPPELPEDGRWVSTVTFHQPGTYVLRGRADDGGLVGDAELTVEVR
ncbi:MAG: hypothetical protein H7A04_15835 [Pseudomonadales bacterium]|nr:hypothetical protein [Pseudomonadales bacterium]